MDMLPGFDSIPEATIEERAALIPAVKPAYYLRILLKGQWWFLWKTHTNGGCVWEKEATMGRMKPLRYKTLAGARRQLLEYTCDWTLEKAEVAIWKEAAE